MHQQNQRQPQKRASPYSKTHKCPSRVFLSEAIPQWGEMKKETNDSIPKIAKGFPTEELRLRIMGIIVTAPSLSKSESKNRITKHWAFLLDDGTAIIDVVVMREEEGEECLVTGDDHHVQEASHTKHRPLQLELLEGDCIDCIGKIEYANLSHGNRVQNANYAHSTKGACQLASSMKDCEKFIQDRSYSSTNRNEEAEFLNSTELLESFEPISYFIAQTVSKVSDPNMFILRMAELSFSARSKLSKTCLDIKEETNETGIYMYGDVMSKDSNKERPRILYLIQLSRPDGLSENELEVLLGYESIEERNSLRYWLDDMHANFEIYQNKDRSYLPL